MLKVYLFIVVLVRIQVQVRNFLFGSFCFIEFQVIGLVGVCNKWFKVKILFNYLFFFILYYQFNILGRGGNGKCFDIDKVWFI